VVDVPIQKGLLYKSIIPSSQPSPQGGEGVFPLSSWEERIEVRRD